MKVDRIENESLYNLCVCDCECVHAFMHYKHGLWGFQHIACHNSMTLHIYTYMYLYIYMFMLLYLSYISV